MLQTSYSQIDSSLVARVTIKIWWMLAMVLIALSGGGCALSAYGCLSSVVLGRWQMAMRFFAGAISGGISAILLCRYRGDLVGD